MNNAESVEKILKKDFMQELRKIDGILIQNNIEIWKPIAGYDNYEVSNMGRVKNVKTNNDKRIVSIRIKISKQSMNIIEILSLTK